MRILYSVIVVLSAQGPQSEGSQKEVKLFGPVARAKEHQQRTEIDIRAGNGDLGKPCASPIAFKIRRNIDLNRGDIPYDRNHGI